MPTLSHRKVRELASFRGRRPVVTCYLDVDGRRLIRPADVVDELERLIRARVHHQTAPPAPEADLERIRRHVANGFDRHGVRGLVMVSCQEPDLWEVIPLSVPVRSDLHVHEAPAVSQLESVVQQYEPIGVLLVDSQRARMLVFHLGELVDHSERLDRLPRDVDAARGSEYGDHIERHTAELVHQHLRRAAEVAFEVHRDIGYTHLALGGPAQILGEVESHLHPYVRDRVVARLELPTTASPAEVRDAVLEVETQIERRREAEAVGRLREEVGAGGRGVAGLEDTLEALAARRVERLLVSHGYRAPGWRCPSCRCLATRGPSCPVCGTPMTLLDDVVEEAVEDALEQGCQVEICIDNADLDVLGRIGALLRY